jgi:hypothetical protein
MKYLALRMYLYQVAYEGFETLLTWTGYSQLLQPVYRFKELDFLVLIEEFRFLKFELSVIII